MKTLKINLFFIFLTLLFGIILFLSSLQSTSAINFTPQIGMGKDFPAGVAKPIDPTSIGQYIRAIYNYAIGIVGILAVVVMMVGGIIWITAGGNAERVGQAKAWIAAAITGLILTLCSFVILKTVNSNLVEFKSINPKPTEAPATTGRCLTECLPGPYCCEDNTTETQCIQNNPNNQWLSGATCPTPCCAWELHVTATALCAATPGCTGNLYVNCDDTQKNLTQAGCEQKPGLTSYISNGQCYKRTLVGTTNTLTSYQCVTK